MPGVTTETSDNTAQTQFALLAAEDENGQTR